MADSPEVTYYATPFSAALAFLYVAKCLRAYQPRLVRETLKKRATTRNFSIEEFQQAIRLAADQVLEDAKPGFPVQLIVQGPGSEVFLFKPRLSIVMFNFAKRSVKIVGTDDDAAAFRKALAKVNPEGLDDSEAPPDDRQGSLF